ncbi:MAG: PqqD family protein [Ruminococcaceae bacterium]|nr:PqqD family protein [Oscillospiraceae bacterium]
MIMKLKDGFILRTVAGETVVLPAGGVTDFDMMITLNDTARFLWERLTVGAETEELVNALLGEYDVTRDVAQKSVEAFVNRLKELDFLA